MPRAANRVAAARPEMPAPITNARRWPLRGAGLSVAVMTLAQTRTQQQRQQLAARQRDAAARRLEPGRFGGLQNLAIDRAHQARRGDATLGLLRQNGSRFVVMFMRQSGHRVADP